VMVPTPWTIANTTRLLITSPGQLLADVAWGVEVDPEQLDGYQHPRRSGTYSEEAARREVLDMGTRSQPEWTLLAGNMLD
jgi:hypothetical protein